MYGGISVITILIPFIFSFTALGHAERYLPKKPEQEGVEAASASTTEEIATA